MAWSKNHSHDDTDVLTIGCPACVEIVRRDQIADERAELPRAVRTVTVEWSCSGTATVEIEMPIDIESAGDVNCWLTTPEGMSAEREILDAVESALDVAWVDEFEVESVSPPPPAPATPAVRPLPGQLDVFGGAV